MVQRTPVRGINRYGRASQGVRLMNLKDDDTVSAVALVAESEADVDAAAAAAASGTAAAPETEAPEAAAAPEVAEADALANEARSEDLSADPPGE
jgi:DNA gyrase subunit A